MKALDNIKKQCAKAIEDAAYESYNEYMSDGFEAAKAEVDVNGINIEVNATKTHKGVVCFEVFIDHKSGNEVQNVEMDIEKYLSDNCDLDEEWHEAYENDDWRDVDPGCDPAFPHYGDFERWAYGR